jgi:acylphosphatase
VRQRGHFICHGRVQGVFFRVSARTEAIRLGLTGWIRNCPDHSVEAVVEGDVKAVDTFYRWSLNGPPYADVARVDHNYSAATGEFSGFNIHY